MIWSRYPRSVSSCPFEARHLPGASLLRYPSSPYLICTPALPELEPSSAIPYPTQSHATVAVAVGAGIARVPAGGVVVGLVLPKGTSRQKLSTSRVNLSLDVVLCVDREVKDPQDPGAF